MNPQSRIGLLGYLHAGLMAGLLALAVHAVIAFVRDAAFADLAAGAACALLSAAHYGSFTKLLQNDKKWSAIASGAAAALLAVRLTLVVVRDGPAGLREVPGTVLLLGAALAALVLVKSVR